MLPWSPLHMLLDRHIAIWGSEARTVPHRLLPSMPLAWGRCRCC